MNPEPLPSFLELILACSSSENAAAWQEFVWRFHRPISLSVIRTARRYTAVSRQLVDDLVQETYLKLCAEKDRLREFAAQHPDAISNYIKAIAVNVVHDHFKSVNSDKRGAGRACEPLEGLEIAAEDNTPGSVLAMERFILLNEVAHCLDRCSEGPDQDRDRMIFWLHYRQGMSAETISSLLAVGLTPKGVESAILRMTRLVRQEMASPPMIGVSAAIEKGLRPAESY